MSITKKPLHALTSLRFFASAAIVYLHGQGVFFPPVSFPPLPFALGVSFFFVLSGFILTYAYSDSFTGFKFYRSRIAKLWPLHLFTALFWIIVNTDGHISQFSWGWQQLLNIALLQAWVPVVGNVFGMNGVSWSISAEIFFYAIFPLLRGRFFWSVFWATAISTFAILIFFDNVADPVRPPWPYPAEGNFFSLHVVLQFPLMRLLEFCTGVAAGKIFMKKPIASSTFFEILSISMIFMFAMSNEILRSFIDELGFSHLAIWINQCGCMFIFAFTIYIFAQQNGLISKILAKKIFVMLGEISFSTYMIHIVIFMILGKSGVLALQKKFIIYIIAVFSIFCASYLSHKYIEVPSKRIVEKILNKLSVNKLGSSNPQSI